MCVMQQRKESRVSYEKFPEQCQWPLENILMDSLLIDSVAA